MKRLVAGVVATAAIAGGSLAMRDRKDDVCMVRPRGVSVAKCSAVCGIDPSGKRRAGPCDPGVDNVMQPGQWVDNGGCKPVPCVVLSGAK